MRKRASRKIPEDLRIAKTQIAAFEAAGRIIQECQARLPLPSPEEMAHIKKVKKTLTPETYRIGIYQRVMMAIENGADDLRALYENLENLQELHLSADEVSAIEAAVEALGEGASSRPEKKP